MKRTVKGEDRYCALGVACKIFENETGTKLDYKEENKELPEKVWKWYGLRDCDPKIYCGDTVSVYNDEGVSFIKIANRIKIRYKLKCY